MHHHKTRAVTWMTKGSVRIELERKLGIIDSDIFNEAYNDTHMGEDIEDYFNRLSTEVDRLRGEYRQKGVWLISLRQR